MGGQILPLAMGYREYLAYWPDIKLLNSNINTTTTNTTILMDFDIIEINLVLYIGNSKNKE